MEQGDVIKFISSYIQPVMGFTASGEQYYKFKEIEEGTYWEVNIDYKYTADEKYELVRLHKQTRKPLKKRNENVLQVSPLEIANLFDGRHILYMEEAHK